jgi:hypothetical protein
VRTKRAEQRLAGVPFPAKQAREARWLWVEPSVWSKRMLTALDKGVKEPILSRPWVVFSCHSPRSDLSILFEVRPPTGEPDAREPHVRFGGGRSRDLNQPLLPLSEEKTIQRRRQAAHATTYATTARGLLQPLLMEFVKVIVFNCVAYLLH